MKKWEKEILQKQNSDQIAVLKKLKKAYQTAISDVEDKIQVLQSSDQTQSVIYQKRYQEALLKDLKSVYGKMNSNWYSDMNGYLQDCYEDGFYQTMYSLHNEGIPLVFPFNQKEAVHAAAQTGDGIKLSNKLYSDVDALTTLTRREITKGIAMNSSYADIARSIEKKGEATLNQAYRIARTESHRIHEEVKFKTINQAADKGADIVKQWDASIDRRTRKSHAALDGQLRELDQPFKSPTSGHTAMYPGGFGIASEDINCRCVVLQRARWALDKSELYKHVGNLDGMTDEQLDELASKMGVSKADLIKKSNGVIMSNGTIRHTIKAKNYNQFKKKYQTKAKVQQAQQAAQQAVKQAQAGTQVPLPSNWDDLKARAKSFSNDYEAEKYHIANNFDRNKWDNDMSSNQRKGVYNYTSWYYRDMNEACRKKRIAGSSYEQYIKDCTSALDKWEIKDDVITYRGIGRKSTFAGEMLHIPQSEFERMVKDGSIAGQKFTDLGFSSTGVTTGAGWTKEVVMECFVPKGTKAMYVDPVSAHPGEKELLFQRGTEFEIVKAEDHGRYIKLFTKVIGQSH